MAGDMGNFTDFMHPQRRLECDIRWCKIIIKLPTKTFIETPRAPVNGGKTKSLSKLIETRQRSYMVQKGVLSRQVGEYKRNQPIYGEGSTRPWPKGYVVDWPVTHSMLMA